MMKTNASPEAAFALLSVVRTELETLPEGTWNLDDASLQGKNGRFVIEAEATCQPECLGPNVWTSVTPAAESFLINSGQRTRFMLSALESVLGLHREMPSVDEYGEPDGGTCCEECKDHDDVSGERVHSVWPCSTVDEITRAMAGEETLTEFRNRMDAHVDAVLAKRGLTAAEGED